MKRTKTRAKWIYTFVSSDEQKIKDFELAKAIYKKIKEKGVALQKNIRIK